MGHLRFSTYVHHHQNLFIYKIRLKRYFQATSMVILGGVGLWTEFTTQAFPHLITRFFHIVSVRSESSSDMQRPCGDLYKYAGQMCVCPLYHCHWQSSPLCHSVPHTQPYSVTIMGLLKLLFSMEQYRFNIIIQLLILLWYNKHTIYIHYQGHGQNNPL